MLTIFYKHAVSRDHILKFFVVMFALLIGGIVRYPYLTATPAFPFGDGGLFLEMIYAIKANQYILPPYVIYNGENIPFAYPPLGFYLALVFSRIFHVSGIQSAQILPVILNLGTVIVFSLLAFEMLQDKIEAIAASFLFPIIFQTYQWTVQGGGLSRSPGFLFAVAATLFMYKYLVTKKNYWLYFYAPSIGFVFLSHLEWALIAIASSLVLPVVFGIPSSKKEAFNLGAAYLASVAISMPWWGIVIWRFGIDPFVNAWSVASPEKTEFLTKAMSLLMFQIDVLFSQNYFLPFFGFLGFIFSLFQPGRRFLPIWLISSFVVASKNTPISGLMPLTLLMAVGLRQVDRIFYMLFLNSSKLTSGIKKYVSPTAIYIIVILLLVLPQLVEKPLVHRLSNIKLTAMEFIGANTAENAVFVVITPADWHSAHEAEWFPYLAKRQSLTTPQGLEWMPGREFSRRIQTSSELAQLMRYELSGAQKGFLADYVLDNMIGYQYVALFAEDLDKEFGGFLETGKFQLFYRKKGVLIFKSLLYPN